MTTEFTKTAEALQKKLGIVSTYVVPRISHVVVSVGVGKQRDNKQFLESVVKDLKAITGQAPHTRIARKSIAGFNVREGNLVGYRVTLRGKRMEDFVRRLVNTALPRVRDFRGISTKSLDGHGNLSIGIREQLAFPEIQPEKTDTVFGLQVTIVTTAESDVVGEELLRALGFPLALPEEFDEA